MAGRRSRSTTPVPVRTAPCHLHRCRRRRTSSVLIGWCLAEEGIRYLARAVELRPRYPEALTYIGLLYRQKSFAHFGDAGAWERTVSQAVAFAARATEKPMEKPTEKP